jgi:hypothetical protein
MHCNKRTGEEDMGLKFAATVFAAAAMAGLLCLPAGAAPKKKTVAAYNRDHTVFVSRDEDGRTRTRVIIQKRSYLDPGTEVFPGENSDHRYAFLPNHHATSVLDRTPFGGDQTALPTVWTLPFKSNPFIGF